MERAKPTPSDDPVDSPSQSFLPKHFLVALLGGVMLWLSFAPVAIWPLAWFAITPWCWLIEKDELGGRRPYLWIWLAGFFYWLATIYFVPIPHPLLWIGWVIFSLYLSLFLPMFIGLSRVLSKRFSVPTLVAAPVVWVGIEYLRSNYVVPFGTILLGHTQYKVPLLIQTADLFGMYTVSFLLALFAMSVTKIWMSRDRISSATVPAVVAITVVAGMVGYGYWKLGVDRVDPDSPVVRLALIQGSIDTEFPATSAEAERILERHVSQYRDLTWQARKEAPDLDLIVWPETVFLAEHLIADAEDSLSLDEQGTLAARRDDFVYFWQGSTGLVTFGETTPPPGLEPIAMMTGVPGRKLPTDESYNSAVLIEKTGEVSRLYHKEHLVIMGEFIPFAQWFPFLYQLSPSGKDVTRGDGPVNFPFGGLNFVPNICFESTVPHLVRRHVNELAAAGDEPDILVNLTNDGWFFGTACLDHHLACNVFRSVEMRKPMLVCANTGFSAVVDSAGQIKNVGPRREVGVLYVNAVREAEQFSLYRTWGDWLPWGCGMICLFALVAGWWGNRKR